MNPATAHVGTLSAAESLNTVRRRRRLWLIALPLLLVLAVVAYLRGGMLDLPSVPRSVTLESAGLAGLDEMAKLDGFLRGGATGNPPAGWTPPPLAVRMKDGLRAVDDGHVVEGLAAMREAIELDPKNLVLANAYRMTVFQLQRRYLDDAYARGVPAPQLPPELDKEPIAFFERLETQHPSRETKLHLAMAWVDHMLLYPALEIKAPSSVSSVDLLTKVIEGEDPYYVPALFARGMNHLHRPARLVWPESAKTPRDAAVRDIALCVAIGRRVSAGSPRLAATLAIALGDGYVKAGRYDTARSWWQIAQNLSSDGEVQKAIAKRYSWEDRELLDQLELELDRARRELDRPMTDLALMWN